MDLQIERADQQDAPSGTAVSTKELAVAGATSMGQTPSTASYYAQAMAAWAPA